MLGGSAEQFGQLLAQAIGFAGGAAARVIVLSIPDWGLTPYARQQSRDAGVVGREVEAFNARDPYVVAGVYDRVDIARWDKTIG